MIPYGKHFIDEEDVTAVVNVLRSDWLTTGPRVDEFEKAVGDYVGAKYAVAVSSGTAALHCAMNAIGIKPGDEVIVPAITFVATANCVCYQGGTPVIADVDPNTLLIDIASVKSKISSKTKAIIVVDYAGQPCDYDSLRAIANANEIYLVGDSCHSLGATYKNFKIGTITDMTVFSFHPVKHVATGEGGMIVTDNLELFSKMKQFQNHGISTDIRQRNKENNHYYEMIELGYNYRITDIQCALGISQLKKLPDSLKRRREIASQYDQIFMNEDSVQPLYKKNEIEHAYHLYVVRLNPDYCDKRDRVFQQIRNWGIGVNVHYLPVHLHPWYKKEFGYSSGDCPIAENSYRNIITLPMWPGLSHYDVEKIAKIILRAIKKVNHQSA